MAETLQYDKVFLDVVERLVVGWLVELCGSISWKRMKKTYLV